MAGQIIKRGENTFLVRVFLGTDGDGKRKYHNKTIHGTKKDAQKYLNGVLRDRDMGTFKEPSKQTLNQYLDQWLSEVARQRLRERTYSDYTTLLKRYVRPVIGGRKLSQITALDIQKLYNDMSEAGLSPRTIRYTHAVLHSAFEQAVKWGMLPRNVTDLIELPQQKKQEMRCLSPAEARKFLDATKGTRWEALFSLMLTTGLRPGEALGLKWSDIDFENSRLHVQRALVRIRNTEGWRLEEPKTARSRRVIPLPKNVLQDLKAHRKRQLEEKLKATEYADHGFVFAVSNGEPLSERNLLRDFKSILTKAGLPDIRLYDLRHTCATLLLAAGENPKIVSERLGHASVTLTLDTYSHVLPDMQKKATEKLEGMLFRG